MVRKLFCRWWVVGSLLGGALHAPAQEVPSQILAALASDEFKQRESGQAGLLTWAQKDQPAALDAIFRQSRSSPDPEVRQRCLLVMRELIMERYLSEGPGFLGVVMNYGSVVPPGETAAAHAVLVTTVRQGTPADRAGVKADDMILRLDGKGWVDESSPDEFSKQMAERKPGTVVKLSIVREGKWLELEATLVRRPASLRLLRFDIAEMAEVAEERAAIDAYFKEWLSQKILRE